MAKRKKKKQPEPDWFAIQGEDLKESLLDIGPAIPNQTAKQKRIRSAYITVKAIVDCYGPATKVKVDKLETAGDYLKRLKAAALREGVELETRTSVILD